jgi:hypothetical protein
MKIRNGFVSNSSSSSFIMIGVPSSALGEDFDEDYHEKDGLESVYVERKGYNYIVGYVLTDSRDDELDDGDISSNEIQLKSIEISDKLGVSIEKVKLYYGTRPC